MQLTLIRFLQFQTSSNDFKHVIHNYTYTAMSDRHILVEDSLCPYLFFQMLNLMI